MRVLVVADTHIPVRARTIPEVIVEEAKKADVIFHCGDFVAESVYHEFQAFGKPFYAVFGNMDDPPISAMLPGKKIVTLEGVKIGLVHGYGPAEGIEERVKQIF
ncbi:MAG: metallophosphoesterase family protein, partial [bacterium]